MNRRPFSGQVLKLVPAAALALGVAGLTLQAQKVGPNVNIVSGSTVPGGDPFLQRQNEPSGAVSTRNPLHLLAGANDYRTVDIPGLPDDKHTGDAWLGIFKSRDGGQTWRSSLLPGYRQDGSAEGQASPLKGYEAGADPIVRASTNGLFYYSGIAFNRGNDAPSAMFVARFIDNNNAPGGDSIAYLDARVLATGTKKPTGKQAQFVDKPYMVVDVPRPGAKTCAISAPGTTAVQQIPAGTVYVAYMLFERGTATTLPKSTLMVTRSLDCGVTWSKPSAVTENKRTAQGVSMAIDPSTGALYLAWREFADAGGGDAVLVAKSTDLARALPDKANAPGQAGTGGPLKFTAPVVVAQIQPFDQGDSNTTFRTNSYPTVAVDATSRVYLAWSERGWGPSGPGGPPAPGTPVAGDARVVMMVGTPTDKNTKSKNSDDSRQVLAWGNRWPIDNVPGRGHQIMPTASIVAGRLTVLFKDFRDDVSRSFGTYVDDASSLAGATAKRHTMDVRVAQADVPDAAPAFAPSVPVSQYLRGSRPGSRTIEQLQFNAPNLPLYAQGTTPFIGDYLDLAGQTMILDAAGNWTFNMASTGPSVQYAFWTDNRDVRPPSDGDWTRYTPPTSAQTTEACAAGRTGMRNANIYSARISPGLLVGSPENTKRLSGVTRSFVVFAQNNTDAITRYRFTIANQPPGGQASFLQFSPAGNPLTTLDATLAPRSMASRTVYVTSSNPTASVKVNVVEVVVPVSPTPLPPIKSGGLQGTIVLNPDVTNPDVTNPDVTNAEVFNPDVTNPDVTNPDVTNPDVTNPDVTNPDVTNVRVANPDVTNPDVTNPDVTNPDVTNPDVTNPDVTNPDVTNGTFIDVTWTVTNNGNTAGAFAVQPFVTQNAPPGFKLQLLIYKIYTTPVTLATDCTLKTQSQMVLIANIVNPDVTNPDVTNHGTGSGVAEECCAADAGAALAAAQSAVTVDDVTDPSITNATLWLEPGESGKITLRMLAPDRTQLVAKQVTLSNGTVQTVLVHPAFDVTEVASVAVAPQAVGTVDAQLGVTTPPVVIPIVVTNPALPAGQVGVFYDVTLTAAGGEPGPRTWSLVPASGVLPPGLTMVTGTGRIFGTPLAVGSYGFTVEVRDNALPANVHNRTFIINVSLQGQGQVVALVTDQTQLPLSNNFGLPSGHVANRAGDLAFWDSGRNLGMFYRSAASGDVVRVVQGGDEFPDVPGSLALTILSVRMSDAGLLAFSADYTVSSGAIFATVRTFDGTTLRTIVNGQDVAPGSGGALYGRNLGVTVNAGGDVLFTSTLSTNQPISLFLVPAGGAPMRVAGPGDAAPGTAGGTFASLSNPGLTNGRDVVFSSTIAGGSGGSGIFVWSAGVVRKVASTGDVNPAGGTFASFGAPRMNNTGQVAFGADGSVFVNTISGTSVLVAAGGTVPAPMGGVFSAAANPTLVVLNDAGQIAFTHAVTGAGAATLGLFRFRPSTGVDVVAYRSQVAPGSVTAFQNFVTISMNSVGTISFRGDGTLPIAIFQQPAGGALTNLIAQGAATPFGGTYDLVSGSGSVSLFGTTLDSGDVIFTAEVPDGTADYGTFRWSPGGTTAIVSTADTLPPGGRIQFAERGFSIRAAGDYIAFTAGYGGGRSSIVVHRISTRTTTVVATDGDAAPVTGGRLRVPGLSTYFVNASGQLAFNAVPVGGPANGLSAVFFASPGGAISTIAVSGSLDTGGRTLVRPSMNAALTTPQMNAAGQVVFSAAVNGGARGLFVGGPGVTPVKLAINGDVTSPAATITTSVSGVPSINASGQVAFFATTTGAVTNLLVGTAGSTAVRIARVGDPAPGGGTFAAFATPSFNSSAEVAFMATITGGSGFGIFEAAPGSAPVALALNGSPSPAGGNYAMTSLRPDVLNNDQHDVAFISDLSGGLGNSAFFIRRGAAGVLQTLVRAGDPAPGTTGVFGPMSHTINNAVGELSQLSSDGDLAFFGGYSDGITNRSGRWRVRTDGSIEQIVLRGTMLPAVGVSVGFHGQFGTWNSGARYPLALGVLSPLMRGGIFLFVPSFDTSTPAGANVVATPVDATTQATPVTVTYGQVLLAGNTTLATSNGGPALPATFAFGSRQVYYNLETTAVLGGVVTVCVDFAGTTFPLGADVKLLKYESGGWQDVTVSGPVGTVICGAATSLSVFTVARTVPAPAPLFMSLLTPNGRTAPGQTGPMAITGRAWRAVFGRR